MQAHNFLNSAANPPPFLCVFPGQVIRVDELGANLTVAYGNKEFKAYLERDEAKVRRVYGWGGERSSAGRWKRGATGLRGRKKRREKICLSRTKRVDLS
jgi:hypothetical protein